MANPGFIDPANDKTEVYRRGSKIVLSVQGCHTVEAALEATQRLAALIAEIEGPVEFIADLSNITGFAAEGRIYWQEAMKRASRRITLMTLVKGTPFARMTASAVGLYTGIKVRSVNTLAEALETRLAEPALRRERRPKG